MGAKKLNIINPKVYRKPIERPSEVLHYVCPLRVPPAAFCSYLNQKRLCRCSQEGITSLELRNN